MNQFTNKIYTKDEVNKSTLEYFKNDKLSTDVWINKYCLKSIIDEDIIYYEKSPIDMHNRLSSEFARIEKKYENPLTEKEIFEVLDGFKYIIPQGSPMSGIGNDNQIVSLSNCYVVGNEFDSYGSICLTDEQQIQLMKRRGGVGHDLSHIRPKGSKVKNSAITSTGIVSFMERYSNSTNEVAQNGRRGALMLSISVNHPDVEDFIDAKMIDGKVTGSNISVRIDDEFMKSIENKIEYVQKYPVYSKEPKIIKKINAENLWKKIIHNAWKSAEPGLLFWDTIIRESVPDCYSDSGFKTTSTNPCIVGNTLIAVADGRNAISIKQLSEEGKDVPVYSTNNEGKLEIKWGRNPRLTGEKKEVWKLTMDDDFTFIATPDHKIYLKNNTYKELKDLQLGESLSSFYSFNSNKGYRQISQIGNKMIGGRYRNRRQYRVIYEFFNGLDIDYKNNAIHHKNFDNKNDSIDNLELMSIEEHKHLHSDRIKGSANPYHRMTDEQKFAFASHPGEKNPKYIDVTNTSLLKHGKILFDRDGKITKKSWIKYASDNKLPQFLGNDFRFKTFSDFKNQIVDNHKVVSVEFYGYEDVYNITVDDNHNYNVITSFEDDKYITSGGICVKNCGEIPLCPYDSCRLLALNLFSYVVNPFTDKSYFDFDLFKKHVWIGQRLMDDLIDLEIEKIDKILEKIESDPEDEDIKLREKQLWLNIKEKTIQGRRTGFGTTGEGDMLASLNKKYGTKEATETSVNIHKFMSINAYKSSCNLAKERGTFEVYDYNKEINNPFINRLIEADEELKTMLKNYGRRNIALLTIAPTGSVSTLTQTTSGIEPVYLVSYKRRRKINQNDSKVKIDFTDAEGIEWEEYNVFHHKFVNWLKINNYDVEVISKMKDADLNEIIKKSPYYGSTSNDIDWVEKVNMQGQIQKWIDHSISVTVNLPSSVTEELVSKVYEIGWKCGCKGMTIYRDGSRQGVILKKDDDNKNYEENNVPKRPKVLDCDVIRFTNKGEKWIGFIGLLKGRPYEVFTGLAESFVIPTWIEKGQIRKEKVKNKEDILVSRYDFIYLDKEGYEVIMTALNRSFSPIYWNIGKMTSALLRHHIHLPSVIEIIDSLNLDGDTMGTWKKGVTRMLKKYVKDGKSDKTCPNCGSKNLINKEGCIGCLDCDWSRCS